MQITQRENALRWIDEGGMPRGTNAAHRIEAPVVVRMTNAVASTAQPPAPAEYRNTLPALEDEYRRGSKWYAKIFKGDDLVATVRAATAHRCAREIQNELHHLKYPQMELQEKAAA